MSEWSLVDGIIWMEEKLDSFSREEFVSFLKEIFLNEGIEIRSLQNPDQYTKQIAEYLSFLCADYLVEKRPEELMLSEESKEYLMNTLYSGYGLADFHSNYELKWRIAGAVKRVPEFRTRVWERFKLVFYYWLNRKG